MSGGGARPVLYIACEGWVGGWVDARSPNLHQIAPAAPHRRLTHACIAVAATPTDARDSYTCRRAAVAYPPRPGLVAASPETNPSTASSSSQIFCFFFSFVFASAQSQSSSTSGFSSATACVSMSPSPLILSLSLFASSATPLVATTCHLSSSYPVGRTPAREYSTRQPLIQSARTCSSPPTTRTAIKHCHIHTRTTRLPSLPPYPSP